MKLVGIVAAILLTLALGGARAEAETFDCQHPSLPLARLICGDAVLRAADADENGIYGTALTASLDKAALREEERAWFAGEILPYNFFVQHQMPVDNAKVAEAYRQRDEALRQETQAWRKLRHAVPGATLAASVSRYRRRLARAARSLLSHRSKEPDRCVISCKAMRNRRSSMAPSSSCDTRPARHVAAPRRHREQRCKPRRTASDGISLRHFADDRE